MVVQFSHHQDKISVKNDTAQASIQCHRENVLLLKHKVVHKISQGICFVFYRALYFDECYLLTPLHLQVY